MSQTLHLQPQGLGLDKETMQANGIYMQNFRMASVRSLCRSRQISFTSVLYKTLQNPIKFYRGRSPKVLIWRVIFVTHSLIDFLLIHDLLQYLFDISIVTM